MPCRWSRGRGVHLAHPGVYVSRTADRRSACGETNTSLPGQRLSRSARARRSVGPGRWRAEVAWSARRGVRATPPSNPEMNPCRRGLAAELRLGSSRDEPGARVVSRLRPHPLHGDHPDASRSGPVGRTPTRSTVDRPASAVPSRPRNLWASLDERVSPRQVAGVARSAAEFDRADRGAAAVARIRARPRTWRPVMVQLDEPGPRRASSRPSSDGPLASRSWVLHRADPRCSVPLGPESPGDPFDEAVNPRESGRQHRQAHSGAPHARVVFIPYREPPRALTRPGTVISGAMAGLPPRTRLPVPAHVRQRPRQLATGPDALRRPSAPAHDRCYRRRHRSGPGRGDAGAPPAPESSTSPRHTDARSGGHPFAPRVATRAPTRSRARPGLTTTRLLPRWPPPVERLAGGVTTCATWGDRHTCRCASCNSDLRRSAPPATVTTPYGPAPSLRVVADEPHAVRRRARTAARGVDASGDGDRRHHDTGTRQRWPSSRRGAPGALREAPPPPLACVHRCHGTGASVMPRRRCRGLSRSFWNADCVTVPH